MHDHSDPSAPMRDEFLRVWRRVAPSDTPDSPVVVYDTLTPPAAGADVRLPAALEALMLRERAAARALRVCCFQLQAAAAAYPGDAMPDAELQALCIAIASEKERHAEALRAALSDARQ